MLSGCLPMSNPVQSILRTQRSNFLVKVFFKHIRTHEHSVNSDIVDERGIWALTTGALTRLPVRYPAGDPSEQLPSGVSSE